MRLKRTKDMDMEKLLKVKTKIMNLENEIRYLQEEMLFPIDKVAPGTFEFVSGGTLREIHNEKAYDLHFREWFNVEEEVRPFIKVIAETMNDQDFPVPVSDLKYLLEMYECNEAEEELLKSAASSDEAYEGWIREERRMMMD